MKESGADYVYVLGDTPTFIALRKPRWTRPATSPRSSTSSVAPSCRSSRTPPAISPTVITLEAYWLPTPCRIPGAAELGAAYEADTGKTGQQILGPSTPRRRSVMQAISKAGGTQARRRSVDAPRGPPNDTFVCGPIKFDANHTSPRWTWSSRQWQDATSGADLACG